MIIKTSYDKDLLGNEIRGTNTSYYGLSALQEYQDDIRQDIAKCLFKDCVVDGKYKGIVIGFEDNNQFFDYTTSSTFQNLIRLFINYVMMQNLLILLRYEKESFNYFND